MSSSKQQTGLQIARFGFLHAAARLWDDQFSPKNAPALFVHGLDKFKVIYYGSFSEYIQGSFPCCRCR
ncbi:hypothetical protein BU25DRAFT_245629 [Macroventuria anomochaeta]|uniref:Uncharacterized protein n=1 Tax=Macroventuria anomochaeta TaxID=301207 RepID=A0ACB6S9Q0_9PLEO|nr:uncharacterized protein BU25DRAFT_245629 [Macroventuria anomochaeta]KAF2630703.1 hypothetical protein BU25DRAFT_245629 [Macroventuria anomochaeta]